MYEENTELFLGNLCYSKPCKKPSGRQMRKALAAPPGAAEARRIIETFEIPPRRGLASYEEKHAGVWLKSQKPCRRTQRTVFRRLGG